MAEYTLRVRRFQPEARTPEGEPEGPYWEDFDVELEETLSVLDGLLQARSDKDGSLAVRCSCRAAICGSCGVKINGQSALACKTQLQHASDEAARREGDDPVIVVEPMGNMPVIKDLITDMESTHWTKVRRVTPWLLPGGEEPERENVVPRDSQRRERLYDLAPDPHGIYDCTHCFACIDACPKGVAPMDQIMRLRRAAGRDEEIHDRNNGHNHEAAFVKIIEKKGTLDESLLLQESYAPGVKGKLIPRMDAIKGLLTSIPTAVRGIRTGKMRSLSKLIPGVHPKLPGDAQDHVRRIYAHAEEHHEELNLYVAGEEGDESPDLPSSPAAAAAGSGEGTDAAGEEPDTGAEEGTGAEEETS